MNWTGSKEIGRGWGDFKQIIPMGDGVIYTITQNGNLEWRKHVGYLDGRGLESPGTWEGQEMWVQVGETLSMYLLGARASSTRSQILVISGGIATRISCQMFAIGKVR
jgi:hypothetical protein